MRKDETPENRNVLRLAEENVERALAEMSGWSLMKITVVA